VKKKITYKKAGVNMDQTDAMIKNIKTMCRSTYRKEVLGTIGGFSGFFNIAKMNIKNPVLVGATDGVGTKLMIAQLRNKYDTIGVDLVAMCVNDVITCGATPLFFLDYFATGKVNPKHFFALLRGIVSGCKQANSSLIGGEIAEMPGMYDKSKYDLAGFSVGIVDRKEIIDGTKVKAGDVVIGIASNGLHSNGYSLARKLFSRHEIKNTKWGSLLLKPTVIYVSAIQSLQKKINIKGIAHITGGGLYDNIPRVLKSNLRVTIDKSSWKMPMIYKEIIRRSSLNDKELYRTFNMGIGMIVIINSRDVNKTIQHFKKQRLTAFSIGKVSNGKKRVTII